MTQSKSKQAPPKATSERITLKGEKKSRVVYVGPRGGKYIFKNKGFVPLKKQSKVPTQVQRGGLSDDLNLEILRRICCSNIRKFKTKQDWKNLFISGLQNELLKELPVQLPTMYEPLSNAVSPLSQLSQLPPLDKLLEETIINLIDTLSNQDDFFFPGNEQLLISGLEIWQKLGGNKTYLYDVYPTFQKSCWLRILFRPSTNLQILEKNVQLDTYHYETKEHKSGKGIFMTPQKAARVSDIQNIHTDLEPLLNNNLTQKFPKSFVTINVLQLAPNGFMKAEFLFYDPDNKMPILKETFICYPFYSIQPDVSVKNIPLLIEREMIFRLQTLENERSWEYIDISELKQDTSELKQQYIDIYEVYIEKDPDLCKFRLINRFDYYKKDKYIYVHLLNDQYTFDAINKRFYHITKTYTPPPSLWERCKGALCSNPKSVITQNTIKPK